MAGAGRVAAQVVEVILLIGLQFQAAIKISFNIEGFLMGSTLERPSFFSLSLSLSYMLSLGLVRRVRN